MENNKKEHLTEDVSLHNNPNLVVESGQDVKSQEEGKYKVNFHSDLINEIVGDLDITV